MDDILWFSDVGLDDLGRVGGKNASLGEMLSELGRVGVAVPDGFATTAGTYRAYIEGHGLVEQIEGLTAGWDGEDVADLQVRAATARQLILDHPLPEHLADSIREAYAELSSQSGVEDVEVAVRSSATAEDLPEASFAGQQETYLMVSGAHAVVAAVHRCFASLFTARAVSYRRHMGIDDRGIALSAGVQRMVRSDLASAGVMFTLDPDSGHPDLIHVSGAWGSGENVVQGKVTPDSWLVHGPRLADGYDCLIRHRIGAKELTGRFEGERLVDEPTPADRRVVSCLEDNEVLQLARWAATIERHYSTARGVPTPMDIEWAKDGRTGELFIVQARPETVHSQATGSTEIHRLIGSGPTLAEGLAVGRRIASGPVYRVDDVDQLDAVPEGAVLVTEITDPDWEPVLARIAALVTERGGRTSHAAIVARELSLPAIVGAGSLDDAFTGADIVTIDCSEGDIGRVLDGDVPFEVELVEAGDAPVTRTPVMLNVADPSRALTQSLLPSEGVGLARMEFVYANEVGIHPMAALDMDGLDADTRSKILQRCAGHATPADFIVDSLADGLATIAAAFWPRPVTVRFSDFKSNEYAHLLGGEGYEPDEANPMIGWRGASRYHHPDFKDAFALEVEAVARVRDRFGLTNLRVMIPFCRTVGEGQAVLDILAEGGLERGVNGLEVWVMAEIPSNVFRAGDFAELFDGFSIGSNDLTQLVLGVDRDSATISDLFREDDPAVLDAIRMLIEAATEKGCPVGICGQAPSDREGFAALLVEMGISSVSVTPDALQRARRTVAAAEAQVSGPDLEFEPTAEITSGQLAAVVSA